MSGRPPRLVSRLAQLALAVLLFAPLVAGAHVHGGDVDRSAACSVCTVAKHAPAVAPPTTPAPAAGCVAAAPESAVLGTPRQAECRRPAGRAPPTGEPRHLT